MSAPRHTDLALEECLVGYLLRHPRAQKRARRLDPDALFSEAHRAIFGAILRVTDTGAVARPADVARELRTDDPRRTRERAELVQDLVARQLPDAFDPDLAIERLHDLARPRRLSTALREALAAADSGDVERAQAAVSMLAASAEADDEGAYRVTDGAGLLAATLDEMRARLKRVPLRLGDLDPVARHMGPGDMVTVGGETGAGKSSLCLWLAREWYRSTGAPMGVVSLEDRWHTWGDRYQAQHSGVSLLDTPHDYLAHALTKVNEAAPSIPKDGIQVAELVRTDLATVVSAMRALVARGCSALVVDYIQEVRMPANVRRAEAVADAARTIKATAKALRVPLVLCSQLSRPPSGAQREPNASRLKESGDLENMSEAIVLLWREMDGQNAPAFAKVAKLKSSSARPRLEVKRGKGGTITGFESLDGGRMSDPLDSVEVEQ
jgi:replicative DNA helicase